MKMCHWTAPVLIAIAALCFCTPAQAADLVKIQGAGASFPAPLYLKWFKAYSGSRKNVQIDYQSVGSGSGVKSFIDKTVDFGASDAAMTPEEVAKVNAGALCLPMTAGSIVLAYNVQGVPGLRLSRKAYAGVFLGTVKKWSDPLIAQTNPGAKLPDSPINVVVRADSSGTTFVFTKHLSTISPEFAKSPGINKMPNWPVGARSKGNEGVTAAIKTTPNSIGYVEYGYARSQKLATVMLENKAGAYVAAATKSGQAALASAQMPADLIRLGLRSLRQGRLPYRYLYVAASLQAVPGQAERPPSLRSSSHTVSRTARRMQSPLATFLCPLR